MGYKLKEAKLSIMTKEMEKDREKNGAETRQAGEESEIKKLKQAKELCKKGRILCTLMWRLMISMYVHVFTVDFQMVCNTIIKGHKYCKKVILCFFA